MVRAAVIVATLLSLPSGAFGDVGALPECSGSRYVYPFLSRSIQDVSLNSLRAGDVGEAEIGQSMIPASQISIMPDAIILKNDVDYAGTDKGVGFNIHIPAGSLLAESNDAHVSHYVASQGTFRSNPPTKRDAKIKVGITIPHNPNGRLQVFWWKSPTVMFYDIDPGPITKINCMQEARGRLRQELVYSGVSQNTVTLLYREFAADLARPAFSQELKYDLSGGNEIGYKGARFQVIKATNTSIRFKVLKPLD